MSKRKPVNPFPADRVQTLLLDNGLRVLLLPDHTAPVVAIVTRVNAGYFDETDDVSGIAHVLEHMFFKGTARRGVGAIAKETKASGGYLNAHTIYDNTTYYTVLPSSGLLSGLDIQYDALANSAINSDELARELEVIIQEARRKADNPSAVATETLYEMLHDLHRIRRWRIGREAGLRKLTREKVLGFYRNFYKASNTSLTVVGDFDVDQIVPELNRLYGQLAPGVPLRSPGPIEKAEAPFRFRELCGDIAQTQTVLGWRTPPIGHDDTPALDFTAAILALGRASRLYRAVRERKLAVSVSAHNYTPTELGVFHIHSAGEPDTSAAAACAMWTEVMRLREEAPDDSEMVRVKNLFESQCMRRQETMDGKANYLADWEGLGDWRLGAKYFDSFMSVTGQDVTRVAAEHLRPESASVLFYRPSYSPVIATDSAEMLKLLEGNPSPRLSNTVSSRIPPAQTGSAPRIEGEECGVLIFRTDAGVPILVGSRPASGIVYIQVQATGGSSMESMAQAGITTIAARATLKGTATHSAEQIASLTEEMGGSIGISVGRESTTWTFSVPTHAFERGMMLLSDVIQNPVISEDAVETERHAALSSLALQRDDMYSYPVRLATLGAFAGHPYGIPVTGTDETLANLGVQTVRDWYQELLGNSEWTIGIVGRLEPNVVAGVTASAFRKLKQGARIKIDQMHWPEGIVQEIETRNKAQTAIALAFCGPGRADPERYAAGIIAVIASGLGGRFFDELRDRQSLAYTVHAQTAAHPAGGIFLSYIATSPEKEDAARVGLLDQFAQLVSEPVSADELKRAQEYAIGANAIRRESGAAVLADMISAWSFGAGLGEIDEYADRIRSVTAAGMRDLARRYFLPHRRVEGIVRGTAGTF